MKRMVGKIAYLTLLTLLYMKLYLSLGFAYGAMEELAQRRWTWIIAVAAAALYLLLFNRRQPHVQGRSPSRRRVWLAVLTLVLALHLGSVWFGRSINELWNPTFYLAALIDTNNWITAGFSLLAWPFLGESAAWEISVYQYHVIQQLLFFAALLGWARLARQEAAVRRDVRPAGDGETVLNEGKAQG